MIFLLEVIGGTILFIIITTPIIFVYCFIRDFIRIFIYSVSFRKICLLTREELIDYGLIKPTDGYYSESITKKELEFNLDLDEPFDDLVDRFCLELETDALMLKNYSCFDRTKRKRL